MHKLPSSGMRVSPDGGLVEASPALRHERIAGRSTSGEPALVAVAPNARNESINNREDVAHHADVPTFLIGDDRQLLDHDVRPCALNIHVLRGE